MTITQAIDQVEDNKKATARQLCTEIAFMRRTLGKLRKEIDANGVLESFSQGKQSFKREAPALKSYSTLVARFSTLHRQLCSLLPTGVSIEEDAFDSWLHELDEE